MRFSALWQMVKPPSAMLFPSYSGFGHRTTAHSQLAPQRGGLWSFLVAFGIDRSSTI